MSNTVVLTKAIKAYCEESETTLHSLSLKAGVCYPTMVALTKGTSNPRYDTLSRISRAMGILPSELLKRSCS